MNPTPGALLLDLDGTLVDTLGMLFEAFRHAVEPFVKVPPTNREIVATFGPAEPECIARFLAQAQRDGNMHCNVDEVLEPAVERFFQYYETNPNHVRAFPGMLEIIHECKDRGWKTGIFTGKGRRGAEYTLQQLRLWPHVVDCLVSSDDVTHSKPHPEGVNRAKEELEVSSGILLFVGDAPADIESGKAAGVKTAAALWGAFDEKATRIAQPDYVLNTVSDLQSLLNDWFKS